MVSFCGRARLLMGASLMMCTFIWCGYILMDSELPESSLNKRGIVARARWRRPLRLPKQRSPRHATYHNTGKLSALTPGFDKGPKHIKHKKQYDLDFEKRAERKIAPPLRDKTGFQRVSGEEHRREEEVSDPNTQDSRKREDDEDSFDMDRIERQNNGVHILRWKEKDMKSKKRASIENSEDDIRMDMKEPGDLQRGRLVMTVDKKQTDHDVKGNNNEEIRQFVPDFNPRLIRGQVAQVKTEQGLFHDMWIVITSVLEPTEDVKFISRIPGWKVLVVGDTKTPKNWSYPNCEFLSVSDQESSGLGLVKHLPYRSYARKNIGYLYAIAHGAKVIYETDDDNRPLDLLENFQYHPTMSGLMFAGRSLFNPYHHFGQSTLWPRGYPLAAIGSPTSIKYRLSSKWNTPAIQQGVVNGDPDMDAIFRLTRKQTRSRLQVKFDPAAPPAILPEGVYSPFNSQNTLFKYEALWAMLLPTTTSFRMCDIWRSYWAQRLLWEIGERLAFFPPNAYQQRNAHSYMADAVDEKDMYFDTERLIKFLTNWSCPKTFSFFQCVFMLSKDMADEQFWKAADIEVTRVWLEDLVRIGYQEPQRVPFNLRRDEKRTQEKKFNVSSNINESKDQGKENDNGKHELEARRFITLKNGTVAYFASTQQKYPNVFKEEPVSQSSACHHAQEIASLCSEIETTNFSVTLGANSRVSKSSSFFEDILLVIVFNWPHYSNVKYLEIIYRPLFPNIAYCGGLPDLFMAQTKDVGRDLTFIDAPVLVGVYGYTCFIAAVQMNYNVTGYLVVGDDVLLNVWNFHGYNKSRIWANYAAHIFDVRNGTNWLWWGHKVGEHAYNNSMAALWKQEKRKAVQWRAQCNQQKFNGNAHNETNRLKNLKQEDRTNPDLYLDEVSHLQEQQSNSRLQQKQERQQKLDQKQDQQTRFSKDCTVVGNEESIVKTFLLNLHNNTGGPYNCPHAISDVFYIPSHLATNAVHFLSTFGLKGLMLELAVPMTLYGLSKKEDIQFFSGDNLWLNERLDPWLRFTPQSFFLHPVKFSNTSNLAPLCSKYLPTLLRRGHDYIEEKPSAQTAARKTYLARLQHSYREMQKRQQIWLQEQLAIIRKQREEKGSNKTEQDQRNSINMDAKPHTLINTVADNQVQTERKGDLTPRRDHLLKRKGDVSGQEEIVRGRNERKDTLNTELKRPERYIKHRA